MDDNNDFSVVQFLINAEFTAQRGYSYGELLKYLIMFLAYYRDCYIKKDALEQELNFKNKTFSLLEHRIVELENIIKDKETQNEFLINKITRKLSLWERVKGKIKIKY